MILHIKPTETIQEVQEKFREVFSHLKPEFFKKFHKESDEYAKKEQYLHNVTMQVILGHTDEISIPLDKNMTTAAFEKMFEEKYHLHIQIMRLQKDNWLLTTNSQELTLEEQNQKGIDADEMIASELLKDIDAE